MTIRQGFLFLFLAITGWISLCYITDKAFPKEPTVYMSYWCGEIHFGPPEYDWPGPNDIIPDSIPDRPRDEPEEKGAE